MKRFIKLDENKRVIGTRLYDTKVDGEIESDIGELGQIMLPDSSFVDDKPNPYIEARNIALKDLKKLDEDIHLGDATIDDKIARKLKWQEDKKSWNL